MRCDRNKFADLRFRRELAAWVRSRQSERRDGISGEAFGMPDVHSFLGAAVIHTFDISKGVKAADRRKVMETSASWRFSSTLVSHACSADDLCSDLYAFPRSRAGMP